ncbi:hypothetical protein LEM8419_01050 [Neolewinella maritima]|uniref:SMEK domain-containing protein n=1 Tax=Neolewinella maritima TaxID=1383882 RepID=A0ABM9AYF4_9BACT|nr:SMEK domain-containing protein [Neolewinella maritima]CAH0999750.1 hypothetical protein LEM8419_01050 [Neolewinella maritima]
MSSINLQREISMLLSITANDIIISNKGFGYYNINKYIEHAICRIFEIIYDKEFAVLETYTTNHPGVDIGSADGDMYIQVTSDNSADKIKHTLVSIVRNKVHEHYDTLIILFLVPQYKPTITNGKLQQYLDTTLTNSNVSLEDIGFDINRSKIDLTDFGALIKNLVFGINKLTSIVEILRTEYADFNFRAGSSAMPSLIRVSDSLNSKLRRTEYSKAVLQIISYFDPAIVISSKLLLSLYPFNERRCIEVSNFILRVDDAKLYNSLFHLLKLQSDIDCKLQVSTFFRFNGILRISLHGTDESFAVPNTSGSNVCNCERCSLLRFDYKTLTKKLLTVRSTRDFDQLENPLRTAYSATMIGDYELAKLIYLYLKSKFQFSSNFIARYFIELGLYHLTTYFGVSLDEEDTHQIVNPNLIISSFVSQGCELEKSDFLFWTDRQTYLHDSLAGLERLRIDARRDFENIQYGYAPLHDPSFEVLDAYSITSYTTFGNLLPISSSDLYQDYLCKSLEIFIYSHSTRGRQPSKSYGEFYYQTWIREMVPSRMTRLFHSLPYLRFNRTVFVDQFGTLAIIADLKSMLDSVDSIIHYHELARIDSIFNHVFNILENTLTLFIRTNISNEESDKIANIVCAIAGKLEFLSKSVAVKFSSFLTVYFHDFSSETKNIVFESYNHITVLNEYVRPEIFKSDSNIGRKFGPEYDKYIDFLEASISGHGMGYELSHFLADFKFLDDAAKTRVANILILALKKRPTGYLIYKGVMNDVINLDDYLDKYISDTLSTKRDKYSVLNDGQSQDFDQLLEMLLYLDMSFDQIAHLRPNTEYYNWLIDIHKFDYRKFKHMWILRLQGPYFVRLYKGCDLLIDQIICQQSKNLNVGVSKLYFESLA